MVSILPMMTVSRLVKSLGNTAGELTNSLHFPRLAQRVLYLPPIFDLLGDAVLERFVDPLQFHFGVPACRQLPLASLKQSRIVDRDCRLRRNAGHDPLVARGENAGLRVTEKKSADHLA